MSRFFNKNTKIYTDMTLNNISYIKLNIKFDSQTYPFYPPKIKIISPILKNGVAIKIASLDNLLPSKWNSCVKLEDIITEIKQICENYGEIDNNTNIQEYDELYNELIDLAILFNSSNNLITNESENKKHHKNGNPVQDLVMMVKKIGISNQCSFINKIMKII
nr:ubiquitin conjugating enzyme E2 [Mimivirus sp.]